MALHFLEFFKTYLMWMLSIGPHPLPTYTENSIFVSCNVLLFMAASFFFGYHPELETPSHMIKYSSNESEEWFSAN
jgi:hypothetical protein